MNKRDTTVGFAYLGVHLLLSRQSGIVKCGACCLPPRWCISIPELEPQMAQRLCLRIDLVPGTKVDLTGKYSLDGNQFDFHGKARMETKLSHMVTGWKSVLLKPVDPFFSKHGAGTEVPVTVTGTKLVPRFGLDFGHKGKNQVK